jgi:predicted transcriptional regulator
MPETETETNPIELAAELTMAWLSNPNTRVDAAEVSGVLRQMHQAVTSLASSPQPETETAPEYTPAVSVRKSLASKDHILSMIDGKPYKSLRRHLSSQGLTPQQYRERFGLKADYPMVSESYSQVRRDMARKIGLGRKPKESGSPSAETRAAPETAPKRRGRPKKNSDKEASSQPDA